MSTLTGKTVAETYKDVLHVSNNNTGISTDDSNITYIHDGEGNSSIFGISTTSVHVSGDINFIDNAKFSLGSATNRASQLHVNEITLNGVRLTGDPSEQSIRVAGENLKHVNHATLDNPDNDISGESFTEISKEGEYTLLDGDIVGQTKIIATTGDETDDINIVPTTFASGQQITFKSQPGLAQSVSLIYGTNGWVVTGKSDIYELHNRGPIVT